MRKFGGRNLDIDDDDDDDDYNLIIWA